MRRKHTGPVKIVCVTAFATFHWSSDGTQQNIIVLNRAQKTPVNFSILYWNTNATLYNQCQGRSCSPDSTTVVEVSNIMDSDIGELELYFLYGCHRTAANAE